MAIAIALHVLAAIFWVGGMFFAHYILRLATGDMTPADRLPLWEKVLGRFLPWVWVAVIVLLGSGYWMIFTGLGGLAALPLYLNAMHGIGWLMVLIFLHLWFAPYRRFRQAMAGGELEEAGRRLNQIRLLVTANLWIGILNAVIGSAGRYLV